jgi:hypothetical protein
MGERALTAAEKQRRYRARKAGMAFGNSAPVTKPSRVTDTAQRGARSGGEDTAMKSRKPRPQQFADVWEHLASAVQSSIGKVANKARYGTPLELQAEQARHAAFMATCKLALHYSREARAMLSWPCLPASVQP